MSPSSYFAFARNTWDRTKKIFEWEASILDGLPVFEETSNRAPEIQVRQDTRTGVSIMQLRWENAETASESEPLINEATNKARCFSSLLLKTRAVFSRGDSKPVPVGYYNNSTKTATVSLQVL